MVDDTVDPTKLDAPTTDPLPPYPIFLADQLDAWMDYLARDDVRGRHQVPGIQGLQLDASSSRSIVHGMLLIAEILTPEVQDTQFEEVY